MRLVIAKVMFKYTTISMDTWNINDKWYDKIHVHEFKVCNSFNAAERYSKSSL